MSLAQQLRDYVVRHYLTGSPRGDELLALAERVEALEQAVSPVTEQAPED